MLFEHTHGSFDDVDLPFGSFDGFVHFGAFTEFDGLVDDFEKKFRVFGIFDGFDGGDDEPLNLFAEEDIVEEMCKALDYFWHELFADFDLSIDKVPEIDETEAMFVFAHV